MKKTIEDPTQINWAARQRAALIRFEVINGRPVNPREKTGRTGQGDLWHWGEQVCADAIVTAFTETGRALLMVERDDGHGWALPGGTVGPDETAAAAAVRELAEETGLRLPGPGWQALPARYVPDPRASDEAWMVTVPHRAHLGRLRHADLPVVVGADDARRAAWIPADTYAGLAAHLASAYRGQVFAAHQPMLAELLG